MCEIRTQANLSYVEYIVLVQLNSALILTSQPYELF